MAVPLSREARWVFIGDSITDCGRRECPEAIGTGYVRLVRDWLCALEPANAPEFVNMGISGNKVSDLVVRWERDVLLQNPSLVSVKIGVNDIWNYYREGRVGTPIEDFRSSYVSLLEQLRAAHPKVYLVLCEPSAILPPAAEGAHERIAAFSGLIRDLAERYDASIAPLARPLLDAFTARPDIAWTTDGVHPKSAGHMLLARTWLASQGLL